MRTRKDLVIAPHPFFPAGSALRVVDERLRSACSTPSSGNAMFTPRINFNTIARRWARRHGKPMVGNGDVHRLEMLRKHLFAGGCGAERGGDLLKPSTAGRVQVVAQAALDVRRHAPDGGPLRGQLHPAPSLRGQTRDGASPGSDPGDESTQGGRAAMMLFPAT